MITRLNAELYGMITRRCAIYDAVTWLDRWFMILLQTRVWLMIWFIDLAQDVLYDSVTFAWLTIRLLDFVYDLMYDYIMIKCFCACLKYDSMVLCGVCYDRLFLSMIQIRWIESTHWSRLTHKCPSRLTFIGSDNDLSPVRRQALILTNAWILLIRTSGTNCN